MRKLSFLSILLTVAFFSCKEANEDLVQTPPKDGAIETQITTHHGTGYDVVTTENWVWVKNAIVKHSILRDTVPALGFTQGEGEDSMGNTQNVTVPKDYEIYITVK